MEPWISTLEEAERAANDQYGANSRHYKEIKSKLRQARYEAAKVPPKTAGVEINRRKLSERNSEFNKRVW